MVTTCAPASPTFVAVGLVALATSSSWWPNYGGGSGQLVAVSTAQGTLCGTLVESDDGSVAVEVDGQRLVLGIDQVAGVRPVDSC